MNQLFIIGARAHAREVHEAVHAMAGSSRVPWVFGGFVADGSTQPERIEQRGARIVGGLEVFDRLDPSITTYIAGVGSPADRKRIDEYMTARGFEAAVVVHPSANIGSLVRMQPGCYVAMGASVTTQVELGRHVHVNTGAVVSHDCTIGNYAIVNPNASIAGNVTIGGGAYVGIGASIRHDLTIGEWSTVGLGAAVVKNVAAHTTVVGSPARPMSSRSVS